MRIYIRRFLLCILFLLWAMAAEADKPSLTFGYIEFAPFYSTSPDGKARGPFIDMARRLGEAIGYDIIPVALPPKRAVKLVGSGEVDLWFGLATNTLYNDNVYISKEPIDHLELRAYSMQAMTTFTSRQDLVGKSVVVTRGYSFGGLRAFIDDPKNEIYVVQVSNLAQAFKVLKIRDLDYVIGYTRPVAKILKEYPMPGISSRVLSSLDIHVTLYKGVENANQLMEDFERFQKKHFSSMADVIQ